MKKSGNGFEHHANRRTFLKKGMVAAGAATVGAGLLGKGLSVFADEDSGDLTRGDAAILRFLAALELIESDLWQQYNELGGIQDSEVPGGSGIAGYIADLQNLDMDMPQYIHDNTDDEFSHAAFINAFLDAHGVKKVNLDKFRRLLGSTATGVETSRIGKRLTDLRALTVDTSYWGRYRSDSTNPDFGDTNFAQAVPDLSKGQFPAIPRDNSDVMGSPLHLQAIANTAAFHFAFIEQGGSSLYPSLAQRVTSLEVLRILLSIGPTETSHFQTWHDKAGNAIVPMLAPLTDPTNGLTFPDQSNGGETLQPNLIMPEPTIFLDRKFPPCSIIRPTETEGVAKGAVKALTDDGLFNGQKDDFFDFLNELAEEADEAHREQ